MKLKKLFVALGVVCVVISGNTATAYDKNRSFITWKAYEFYQGKFSGGATIVGMYQPVLTLKPSASTGAWESPTVMLPPNTSSINPSWQAKTPHGSHILVQLAVQHKGKWSNWYNMGDWTFENTNQLKRTSFNNQADSFGTVYTDTFVAKDNIKVDAYRLKVAMNSKGKNQPEVRQLAGQTAPSQTFSRVSHTTITDTIDLNIPRYSQYLHEGEFPELGGGGEAWCSPTSVAMVLGYYHKGPSAADIASLPSDPVFNKHGRKDGVVDYAALHTYDQAYEGTGNWPFNTAYAAHYGLDAAVRVFDSLQAIEQSIKQGNPAVVSIAWNNEDDDQTNDLPNAGVAKTNGHLMVVRGFTKNGDVIANDPATRKGNQDVRRIYNRTAFERQWLNSSNGTAYTFSQ